MKNRTNPTLDRLLEDYKYKLEELYENTRCIPFDDSIDEDAHITLLEIANLAKIAAQALEDVLTEQENLANEEAIPRPGIDI